MVEHEEAIQRLTTAVTENATETAAVKAELLRLETNIGYKKREL